jgi:hypothetical protein
VLALLTFLLSRAAMILMSVRHRPEQNRVTWETPSSVVFPLLHEPIGVLASYAPRANAGIKQTSVVEHNLYFARVAIMG